MTQVAFGKLFGVTHLAVVKWEKVGDKASKINLTTQRGLRLVLLDKLLMKDDDFRRAFRIVYGMRFSGKITPLEFDVPIDLVTI